MLINLDVRKVYLHGMKLQTLLVQLILPLCLTYPRGHRSVLFKTCAFPCHLIYLHKYFIIFYCCLQYLRICSKIRTYLFQTSMISRLTLLNILLQDHYQRLSIIETNESHKDVFRHVGSVVLRYLFSLLACLMSPPPPPYPFRFHGFFISPISTSKRICAICFPCWLVFFYNDCQLLLLSYKWHTLDALKDFVVFLGQFLQSVYPLMTDIANNIRSQSLSLVLVT